MGDMRTVRRGVWGLLAVSCILATSNLYGEEESSPKVIKVEETWELKVGAPNQDRNAPQVTMAMSPFSSTAGKHFVLLLNHRTYPDYAAGGLQVQTWNGGQLTAYRNGPQGSAELENEDESIRWTQKLTVQDNSVVFEIVNGTSTSWGTFGGQGYLRDTAYTGQDNLNSYTPYVSITESGIDYAGNRVVSLVLQRVRWTMSNGQVYQLDAPIDIDSDLDPWSD
jgi:hypothetical protein